MTATGRAEVHWGNARFAALFFGTIFLGVGIWTGVRAWQSGRWVPATGVIERSEVLPVGRDGPDRAIIGYRYVVAGTSHRSERISYGRMTTESGARDLVTRYRPGDSVTVYYNPASPREAVLLRGSLLPPVLLALAAVGCAILWRVAGAKSTHESTANRSD